jgi:hypothetical protein
MLSETIRRYAKYARMDPLDSNKRQNACGDISCIGLAASPLLPAHVPPVFRYWLGV